MKPHHFFALSFALLVSAVALDAACTKTQGDQALQFFESVAGQVCTSHDAWSVCLQKCRDACQRPASSAAASGSAVSQ